MLPAVLDLDAALMVMKPLHVKAAIFQHARSESFIFELEDGPSALAAAMLYPLEPERPGERLVELAFVCHGGKSSGGLQFLHSNGFPHIGHACRLVLSP